MLKVMASVFGLDAVDSRFEQFDDLTVFDSGWIGGRVIVSAEEAVAIRHMLYLFMLLPFAASIPWMLLPFFLSAYALKASAQTTFISFLPTVSVLVLIITAAYIIRYPYLAAVVNGKTKYVAVERNQGPD